MGELSAEPLQWEPRRDDRGYVAHAEHGRYTALPIEERWQASYEEYGASHGNYIYDGPSLSGGMAAAQAHRDRLSRRLAWECYMAENDLPSNGQE